MVEEQKSFNKELTKDTDREEEGSRWVDNDNNAINDVFGFNKNAELVNARAAMLGFLLLILTELVFNGQPVTLAIFGIN